MKLTLDDGREVVLSQELSEKLEKEINEATKEKKKTGFHDLNKHDIYYCVDDDNSIFNFINEQTYNDNAMHYVFNAFTTEEFAEKIAFKQLMERKLLKFSLEHDGDKIDWNDEKQDKFYLYFDFAERKVFVDCDIVTYKSQGCIYFYLEEYAQEAIDEFHDDLIEYFQLDFGK